MPTPTTNTRRGCRVIMAICLLFFNTGIKQPTMIITILRSTCEAKMYLTGSLPDQMKTRYHYFSEVTHSNTAVENI
jgi:hypothetical protein